MNNCIEFIGAKSNGYGVMKIPKQRKNVLVHRVVYCLHNNIDLNDIKRFVVMHICDNPTCINPNHLKLGTHTDNQRDKVEKHRQAKGESIGNSKLKNDEVLAIKKLVPHYNNAEIAIHFDVSSMCISRIRNGKTWRHIEC